MDKVIVSIGLFALIIFQHTGSAQKNNACSKLRYYPLKDISSNCFYNPDVRAKTPDMIIRHGYPVEVHKVLTGDNYILTVYRIPSKMVNGSGNVAFLQHGFMSSSENWVSTGNRSLAFVLHHLGYDVWLGNIRGTEYSSSHISLKSTDNAFWNFSLDTLVEYDIRDSMKYVVGKTKTPMIYIGHSMGSTLVAMFSSEFPDEAQQLIRGVIALCPIVYSAPNAFEKFYTLSSFIQLKIFDILHIYYYINKPVPLKTILQKFCFVFPFVCREAINIAVVKTNQLNPEDLLLLLGAFPDGTSARTLSQFAQMCTFHRFSKYDYGTKKNIEIYGTKEPPAYNLRNIKIPVFIYYGLNDAFLNTKSVTRFFREIGSKEKNMSVIPNNKEETFNHMDFIYGKDIKEYLYKYMFEALETLKR